MQSKQGMRIIGDFLTFSIMSWSDQTSDLSTMLMFFNRKNLNTFLNKNKIGIFIFIKWSYCKIQKMFKIPDIFSKIGKMICMSVGILAFKKDIT